MCSVSGSFSKDKLAELIELNKYRGSHSYSITYYDFYNRYPATLIRKLGEISMDDIDIPEHFYCIVHQQAPTTENKTEEFIHPAEIDGHLLWHNGILKDTTIKELQAEFDETTTWDSLLLLRKVMSSAGPDDIDGSFSCVYYDPRTFFLYLFRNQMAPMFIDNDFNISSTKFANSEPTTPDAVFVFDPSQKQMIQVGEFKTKNLPWILN